MDGLEGPAVLQLFSYLMVYEDVYLAGKLLMLAFRPHECLSHMLNTHPSLQV